MLLNPDLSSVLKECNCRRS